MKIFIISSENNNKFGISKVINQLKLRLRKFNEVEYTNNILNFILFKPDILHIHGCWKIKLIIFYLLAKVMRVKIVISPHGMMDPLSLKQKMLKKKIAMFAYQKFIFENSDLIIVNSEIEKKNFLKVTKKITKIIIIPHGIDLKKKEIRIHKNQNNLKFVFFSRIHPSKNLISLVQIWKNDFFFDDYILDVYGEIEDVDYFNQFKNKIKNSYNINYKGKIEKNNLYLKLSRYDIFLHPSKSENFGLVILEAMACGLFPIVNKRLDWKILDTNNLGCSLNFTNKNLKRLILKLNKSKYKIRNKKFKKKMRNYLLEKYNWDFIIEKYNKCYSKLIN